jgi:hypothetical protein
MASMLVRLFDKTAFQVKQQLELDEMRYGDTWRRRSKKGQEWRIFKRYIVYFGRFFLFREPVPWEKVIGNAHIAMVREDLPEHMWRIQ